MEPDSHLSPGVAAKVIHAASAATGSFDEASENLRVLAEADVSAKRIGRLVTRIGNERRAEIEAQAREYAELPLPSRLQSPVAVTPDLVCVQCDGGRLQVRDRTASAEPTADSPTTYWRESKVGALLTMQGEVYEEDPCPEIPGIFVDSQRMSRLTREIKGFSGDGGAGGKADQADVAVENAPLIEPNELHESTRPQPKVRSVIATTGNIQEFGKLLVGQAYQRGFLAAPRKAFVCDGMACNWTLHEKHFSRFTPILDFVHALCYVYHAAIGREPSPTSWARYCDWAQRLWSGEIGGLLAAMHSYQKEIDLPPDDDPAGSPRRLLADTIRYVTNQRDRMQYAAYRREGLPITSAYIESTIKQINRRVKGTEKFWSINADPMLQLRADAISETSQITKFWSRRPATLTPFTHYSTSG